MADDTLRNPPHTIGIRKRGPNRPPKRRDTTSIPRTRATADKTARDFVGSNEVQSSNCFGTLEATGSNRIMGCRKKLALSGISIQLYLQTVYQPPTPEAYDQVLVAQFVDLTRPQRGSKTSQAWPLELTRLRSSSKLPALKYAIRAASTALHALLHDNVSARAESCRWYIASLNTHQKFLSNCHSSPVDTSEGMCDRGVEELLVPIILCLYEVFSCTTSAGCYQHLAAASRVLEMRGPNGCQTGTIHQIFCALGVSDVSLIVFAKPDFNLDYLGLHIYSVRRPTTLCFYQLAHISICGNPKTPVSSTDRYSSLRRGTSRPFWRTEPRETRANLSKTVKGQRFDQEQILNLVAELDSWWIRFEKQSSPDINHSANPNHSPESPLQPSNSSSYSPSLFIFRDTFTASTVSMYNAASIIIQMILHNNIDAGLTSSHSQQALSSAAPILKISAFQEKTCPIGFDFMRSTFPLSIVALLSSSLDQRVAAESRILE